MEIPKNHPRYLSLKTREKIVRGMKEGIVHKTGLIAHGRGEAFDYLIGETTIPPVEEAEKVAAALLLLADKPVISLNGNVVALSSRGCINLSKAVPADLEVNLFHRTEDRIEKMVNILKKEGAKKVYGKKGDSEIPNLSHDRGLCDKEGIYSADVILVPLEDGDRCEALKKMGKKVIAIDLNPLSRTARCADVTIVDNVIRAIPNLISFVKDFKRKGNERKDLLKEVSVWDNHKMLNSVLHFIKERLVEYY